MKIWRNGAIEFMFSGAFGHRPFEAIAESHAIKFKHNEKTVNIPFDILSPPTKCPTQTHRVLCGMLELCNTHNSDTKNNSHYPDTPICIMQLQSPYISFTRHRMCIRFTVYFSFTAHSFIPSNAVFLGCLHFSFS